MTTETEIILQATKRLLAMSRADLEAEVADLVRQGKLSPETDVKKVAAEVYSMAQVAYRTAAARLN